MFIILSVAALFSGSSSSVNVLIFTHFHHRMIVIHRTGYNLSLLIVTATHFFSLLCVCCKYHPYSLLPFFLNSHLLRDSNSEEYYPIIRVCSSWTYYVRLNYFIRLTQHKQFLKSPFFPLKTINTWYPVHVYITAIFDSHINLCNCGITWILPFFLFFF